MKTEIDPRPVTSFDDLLAFTDAELEEFRGPKQHPVWSKVLAVLLWMPVLIVVFCIVWLACAAYWWGRYWDEVVQGLLLLLQIFTTGAALT